MMIELDTNQSTPGEMGIIMTATIIVHSRLNTGCIWILITEYLYVIGCNIGFFKLHCQCRGAIRLLIAVQ